MVPGPKGPGLQRERSGTPGQKGPGLPREHSGTPGRKGPGLPREHSGTPGRKGPRPREVSLMRTPVGRVLLDAAHIRSAGTAAREKTVRR